MWCDEAVELEPPPAKKKKRDSDKGSGKRQEQEEDVESYYKTLTNKHKELYPLQKCDVSSTRVAHTSSTRALAIDKHVCCWRAAWCILDIGVGRVQNRCFC